MNWNDWLWIICSALLLSLIGWLIYDGIHHHYQEEHTKTEIERWEPPVIPSCNKELWDRIREGCEDE